MGHHFWMNSMNLLVTFVFIDLKATMGTYEFRFYGVEQYYRQGECTPVKIYLILAVSLIWN